MKKIKLFAVVALALVLTSCGGGSGSKAEGSDSTTENSESAVHKIKPQSTNISGALSGCYEITDREYKVTDEQFAKVNVELTRTSKELPPIFDADAVETTLRIEFLDADGDVVDTAVTTDCSFIELLPGEISSVSFYVCDDIKKVTQFRVFSECEVAHEENNTSSLPSSEDIDNSLEQAEKAMDMAGDALNMMDGLIDAAEELEEFQK